MFKPSIVARTATNPTLQYYNHYKNKATCSRCTWRQVMVVYTDRTWTLNPWKKTRYSTVTFLVTWAEEYNGYCWRCLPWVNDISWKFLSPASWRRCQVSVFNMLEILNLSFLCIPQESWCASVWGENIQEHRERYQFLVVLVKYLSCMFNSSAT